MDPPPHNLWYQMWHNPRHVIISWTINILDSSQLIWYYLQILKSDRVEDQCPSVQLKTEKWCSCPKIIPSENLLKKISGCLHSDWVGSWNLVWNNPKVFEISILYGCLSGFQYCGYQKGRLIQYKYNRYMQYGILVWQLVKDRHEFALSQVDADHSHAQSIIHVLYRWKVAEKDVKTHSNPLKIISLLIFMQL